LLKGFAPGEREHRVNSLRRERTQLFGKISASRVARFVCAQFADESRCIFARYYPNHARVPELRELHCQRANCAGSAKHEHCLVPLELEVVIDTLLGSQARHSAGARLQHLQAPGLRCHVIGSDRRILGIKPTLPVFILVRPDAVSNPQSPYALASFYNDARAICTEHEREAFLALGPCAIANPGVPDTYARCVNLDQHLAGTRLRHGQIVQRERRRRSEIIDRSRSHGCGNRASGDRLGCRLPSGW
jgi:hypothetical protein